MPNSFGALHRRIDPLEANQHRASRLGHAILPPCANPRADDGLGGGQLYLARFPEEADEKQLLQTLLTELEVLPDSREALRDHLHSRIEMDFERGEVFHLRGWQLSRTEGRLWALAALEAP